MEGFLVAALQNCELSSSHTDIEPSYSGPPEHTHTLTMAALEDPTASMGGMMNFDQKDAFQEADIASGSGSGNKVHLRIQQRNRRKCVLTVQGLDDDLDLKKICKALRKNLQCNGAIVKDKEFGDVIQLQGDHRVKVSAFLVDQEIIQKDQLVIHGANF